MTAMLEALVLMAAQATAAPPPAPPPAKLKAPPVELLEFLGEWSDEDGKLIDGEAAGEDKAAPPEKGRRIPVRDAQATSP